MRPKYEINRVVLRYDGGEPFHVLALEGPGLYPPAVKALLGDTPSRQALENLRNIVEAVHISAQNSTRAEIRSSLGIQTNFGGDLSARNT